MVVSALGFALVVQEAGDRERVLVLAHDVPAGHVLGKADVRAVEVAAESGVVRVADKSKALGRRTRVPLVAGSLLAPGQVGARGEFPPKGFSQVAFAVEAGAAPPGLATGERVAVLPGPSNSSAEDDEGGQVSAVTGTVTSVRAAESAGGPRVVTVLVETGAVRRAVQWDRPRVVALPAAGREAP
ncbi:SAF domain-containing protein [Streptomyces sp. NPDC050560]|uniref:SAF domain-containing protein n=1 Tax=Streptomyces sp. NPDC050560 TaxID=3365630 RepID=UPI00379FD08C